MTRDEAIDAAATEVQTEARWWVQSYHDQFLQNGCLSAQVEQDKADFARALAALVKLAKERP